MPGVALTLWRTVLRKLTPPEVDANFEALDAGKAPLAGPGSGQAFGTGPLTVGTPTPTPWTGGFAGYTVELLNSTVLASLAGSTNWLGLSSNIYYDGTYKRKAANTSTWYRQADGSHIFSTAATGAAGGAVSLVDQMIITATGTLLAGSAINPYSAKMFVSKAGAGAVLALENTDTAGTSNTLLYGRALGVDRIYILGNGNVQNANNSYGAISDIKLKENISEARSYLEDLCRVNVVKYSLIVEASESATHLGVIAQELEQIFPNMIEETEDTAERFSGSYEQLELAPAVMDGDRVMTPAVYGDDETKPIMERYKTGEITKAVKYSVFVPMLITAVQTLSAENKELKGLVEGFEARLAALEE